MALWCGFAIGPLASAAPTDYLFGHAARLGLAAAVTVIVTGAVGAMLPWSGWRPMRRATRGPEA